MVNWGFQPRFLSNIETQLGTDDIETDFTRNLWTFHFVKLSAKPLWRFSCLELRPATLLPLLIDLSPRSIPPRVPRGHYRKPMSLSGNCARMRSPSAEEKGTLMTEFCSNQMTAELLAMIIWRSSHRPFLLLSWLRSSEIADWVWNFLSVCKVHMLLPGKNDLISVLTSYSEPSNT